MSKLFNLSEEEKNRIRGLHLTESKDNRITSVLSEQKMTPPLGEEKLTITMNFGPGEDTSNWKTWTIDPEEWKKNLRWGLELRALLDKGMASDRPFIHIKGGTSGTGDSKRNQEVMNERMDSALEELESALKIMKIKGKDGLPYSSEGLKSKTKFSRDYDMIEPGSILNGQQVPTDPNDPFFKDKQYVTITLNPPTDTPGYDSLADQFIEATIRNNLGYSEETVYGILDKLRDRADFEEFSAELERSYGMDFYDIACDTIAQDLTPDWFDKIIGKDPEDEVVFATEIGPGDTTINVHLKRLGVDPISC